MMSLTKKKAHLILFVPELFIDLFSAVQVMEINGIIQKLSTCFFDKGVNCIFESTFIKKKKKEELVLAANPILSAALKEKRQRIK
jgi:hypothetical protein